MTDEQLGALFEAFASYYWSIPVVQVINKIAEWHPDVTAKKAEQVLNKYSKELFWHHCCVVDEGLKEPELVTEHLVGLDEGDLDKFIAARMDIPFCECTEEELLEARFGKLNTPEARAIMDFGKTELGLDDEWARQLLDDSILFQPYALCDGISWVMDVLKAENYGKIHFRTLRQVRRFRELGNRLYRVLPNPVLRGWKPDEIEDAPALPDDIPERDEDIPDGRAEMERIFAPFGGREKAGQLFMQMMSEAVPKKKKIGRNEPCPCGSGLKYKKCTCAEYHPVR